jgi:hypothetical protein
MRTTTHLGCALALASLALACSDAGPTAEITKRRTAAQPSSPVLPGATPAQRFGESGPEEVEEPSDDLLAYDQPEGWKALPPSKERMVNLRPAGDPEAACTLSFLPGSAGGLVENVNRWRKQLGAAPIGESAVAALPRSLLLGHEATVVEVAGTFTGMGEGAPRAGFKLLGFVTSEPTGSLFLKFTAPAPLVDLERERFFAFAGSLRLSEQHAQAAGASPSSATAGAGASPLTWTLPSGWSEQPPRPPREASFAIGEGGECTITRLAGDAGGLRANLDRWSGQLGRDRLSDEAFAALERVKMLGQAVPVLAVEGTLTGMDGVPRAGQGLIAVACIRATDSLFVKLTGPEALVRAEAANFRAFVTSLEERP